MPARTKPIKQRAGTKRVVEPFEGRMIARHQLADDVRHDRHPFIAISEDDDGGSIHQRAYYEGFEPVVVAPMEEGACIGFEPPAQPPCDVLIGVLCIRCEAFDAVLPKPDLRVEPSLCSVGGEARTGQSRLQEAGVVRRRGVKRGGASGLDGRCLMPGTS
jgi:hypothetical protein